MKYSVVIKNKNSTNKRAFQNTANFLKILYLEYFPNICTFFTGMLLEATEHKCQSKLLHFLYAVN